MKKYMIIILVLSLLSYLNSYTFGQIKEIKKDETATKGKLDDKQDIKGWGKSEWGMTEKELLEIFNGEATVTGKSERRPDNTYSPIEIKNVKIASHDFRVAFHIDVDDKKLRVVSLHRTGIIIGSDFSGLEELLIEKYG